MSMSQDFFHRNVIKFQPKVWMILYKAVEATYDKFDHSKWLKWTHNLCVYIHIFIIYLDYTELNV